MNFKQFQNIYSGQDWRSTWFTRQDWIKKEGSEYFSWIVPVTIAGAQSSIEIGQQFPRARKYLPLDFIEVMLAGLARDGGLYVPEQWPALSATTTA